MHAPIVSAGGGAAGGDLKDLSTSLATGSGHRSTSPQPLVREELRAQIEAWA